jgi:nucleoside-diphosphate-sugar epimerase
MKILFTGGSSFTGCWFIKELATAGHAVTAIFRKPAEAYEDQLRRQRVALAARVCRAVHGCAFGDAFFIRLAEEGGWDLLCHHAADVANYKSPDFDVIKALGNNTQALPAVLRALKASGSTKVVLTGSFFEGGEGAGSQGLPDFSAYGLSKALTAQIFRFYCAQAGVALGKFVIPNPFGPYEEPRFTTYLVKTWLGGGTPACSSPAYVRDNIHVSLLARAYVRFAENLASAPAYSYTKFNPSGYAESQGAFALRVAQEMRPRLNLPCPLELKRQTEFPEPRVRINMDILEQEELGWDESAAWDDYARYYQQTSGT